MECVAAAHLLEMEKGSDRRSIIKHKILQEQNGRNHSKEQLWRCDVHVRTGRIVYVQHPGRPSKES